MYASGLRALISEVRHRIENVKEEKYRIALMYQFLTATEKAQVCGVYRPKGNDATKIPTIYNLQNYELIVFKITPNRTKENTRYSILPASDDFDPWVKSVYDYFTKYGNSTPFEFVEKKIDTNEKYYMDKAKQVFGGLEWQFPSYSKAKVGKIEKRPKPFTSDALRKLRLNDLIVNYNFTPIDLSLFASHNDGSRLFKPQIKEIFEENVNDYSDTQLIQRTSEYIEKFLKKNEDEEIDYGILTPIHGYFIVWTYDKILEESPASITDIVSDLTYIINKDEKVTISLLEQVSFYDSENKIKPINALDHGFDFLEEIYNWFWNDKNSARRKFYEFENYLNLNLDVLFSSLDDSIKYENETLFVEEGSLKHSTIKIRNRSSLLVKLARDHFKEKDVQSVLRCYICGFTKPSYINEEIVHIHHLEPVKDLDPEGITIDIEIAIKKMIPLCPTCHSIVHSKENAKLSIDTIKERSF